MKAKDAVSVREAARRLGVSLKQVYALLWDNRLGAEKIDGQWRISLKAIDSRLRERAK